MSEGKNVPKIRFPGFEGEWESGKLEDYLSVSKTKNKDELYGKEAVLSVSGEFGIVNQIEFQGRSFAGESVINYGVVNTGDVVYTKSPLKSNPYGIIKTNKGKPGIVSTLYAVYSPKDCVDSEFVQLYYELDSRMNNYMHPLANKGAKNDMKVSDENALKGDVVFPSKKEQQSIKKFFSDIDCYTSTCRTELDKWKELKKGMLQKMFPKEGESVPEIRFPGFKTVWYQKRLVDMSDFITKGATPTTYGFDWVESGIPFFRNDSIKDNIFIYGDYSFISEEAHNNLIRSEIQNDDILVAITGEIGKVGIVPKSIRKGNINQHLARIRLIDGSVPYFVYQSLCTEEQQNKYRTIKTGISMAQLSLEQIRDTIILCPDKAEQECIGSFFEMVDRLICLHQRELDKWKELKKGLLQQMFV